MRYWLILFLLTIVSFDCFAYKIQYNSEFIEVSDKYSSKDFTNRTLLDAKDLEGITIFGSCFSKELPSSYTNQSYVSVFPDNVIKITFVNCNLDNVFIKAGWVVIGGTHRKFRVQSDGKDWVLDIDGTKQGKVNP